MEDLNKNQLILLALLVSFVTSIATGIVTVTLVEQAPTDVVRTIDRVVEKTVEKVVPGETKIIETVKEVQVGATDSERMVKVVSRHKYKGVAVVVGDVSRAGVFISEDGHIATSGFTLPEDSLVDVVWVNTDGELVDLEARAVVDSTRTGVSVLELVKPEPTEGEEEEGSSISSFFGLSGDAKFPHIDIEEPELALGELLMAITLDTTGLHNVDTGIVNSYRSATASSTTQINIDLSSTGRVGSPIFNLDGDFVGLIGIGEVLEYGDLDALINELDLFASGAKLEDNVAGVGDALGETEGE